MKSVTLPLQLPLATSLLLASLSLSHAPSAHAQDAGLASASMMTCNLKGSVRVTVAGGTPTTYNLSCLNPTAQTASGSDDSALIGVHTQGVPGIGNLASINAPFGLSDWTNGINSTVLSGEAGATEIKLLQDAIQAENVAGSMSCTTITGNRQAVCDVAMTLGTLRIAGQRVQLPPNPIPVNTTVAVAGVNLQVQPTGLPMLQVPLSGELVLNQVKVTGAGTPALRIEHAPMAGHLQGKVNVLGIGAVELEVTLEDYDEGSWQSKNGTRYLDPVIREKEWNL